MDLSSYDNAGLIKKFNDLNKVFEDNNTDKTIRDTLNLQLAEIMAEMRSRNIHE